MTLKIAIIGAGSSGLGVLRALTCMNSKLFNIVVYEKTEEIGGLWNYSPAGPIYEHLRTNLPKEIMRYPDLPFDSSIEESFVGHTDVLHYLQSYADQYNLRPYIKFRHSVKYIDPVNTNDSMTSWNVTVIDEAHNKETTSLFDSVVLCNGNYNSPIVPEIPGLKDFEGEAFHSVSYRSSEMFRDKTILVIGAASSGQDIAHESAKFAKKVIISHSGKLIIDQIPNLYEAPRITHINDDRRTVVFQDGSTCQPDVIVFATGYDRSFQFCSSRCHISTRDRLFYPLYKYMIHAEYHRLFVIAICNRIIPFPFAYIQGCLIRSLLEGKCSLPSTDEMLADIEKEKRELLEVEGRPPHHFHVLDVKQFPYLEEIAKMAKCNPPPLTNELIYKHASMIRRNNFSNFRSTNYRTINEKEFSIE